MAVEITVNESVSPGHGSVLVIMEDCKTYSGEPWRSVRILTHYGATLMTYDQWKCMMAIGMSMMMQDGTGNDRT